MRREDASEEPGPARGDGTGAVDRLLEALAADEALLARFAASLWARVGRIVDSGNLRWARNLFDDERAPDLVLRTLVRKGVLPGEEMTAVLEAGPLSRLLLRLATGEEAATHTREEDSSRVVWTLPAALRAGGTGGRGATPGGTSYLEPAVSLIDGARDRVVLISPYVEARGVGLLFERLADAMVRGAKLVLAVFSAGGAGVGGDRTTHPLLHAKMVIADERKVLLGSANLTRYGLGANLEVGTVLGGEAAATAAAVAAALLESGLVRRVFSTTRDAPSSGSSRRRR